MAALIDPHTLLAQENHAEHMEDMNIMQQDTKNITAGNGKAAEAKGAAKNGLKSKKKEDKKEDLLAALSDRRSYFVTQEKRTQQKKAAAADESEITDLHADGRSVGSTESAHAVKKSHKTKKEAENRDDFLAALSDPRAYFAAQVKHTEQKKTMGFVEPHTQNVDKTVKKQSKSKKETENVCIII